jgi:hypothetical protein
MRGQFADMLRQAGLVSTDATQLSESSSHTNVYGHQAPSWVDKASAPWNALSKQPEMVRPYAKAYLDNVE